MLLLPVECVSTINLPSELSFDEGALLISHLDMVRAEPCLF